MYTYMLMIESHRFVNYFKLFSNLNTNHPCAKVGVFDVVCECIHDITKV